MPKPSSHRTSNSRLRTPPKRYEPGFLAKLDGRLEIAKVLRSRYDAVISDLGGDDISHVKLALVERFLWLEYVLQGIEQFLADAQSSKESAELIGRWVQATNSLVGLAKMLGLERQTPTVNLNDYVRSGSK